jgi:outer membrane biosynthesis protein TonB
MKRNSKFAAQVFVALAGILWPVIAACLPNQIPDDEATLWDAICPIVYPVDQSASDHGVHYLFYGNILLRQSTGSPRIVPATLVAIDHEHDVAVLRVVPNPFAANYKVSSLSLSVQRPSRGQMVLTAALLPSKPREAYTLNATIETRSWGRVLDSEFSQLEKGRGDTELFLFSHEIILGQSGAPVVSADSHSVVGLVEGQWFGQDSIAVASAERHTLGAVLSIHYAIALLQQKHIAWHTSSSDSEHPENPPEQTQGFSAPIPLSLVPAAYPSQALFGGEVALDALVDSSGRLADIQVVRGEAPFLEKVLVAVRTWTFLPAHLDSHVVETRIGIAFQFPQPYVPPRIATVHNYEDASSDSVEKNPAERGALPRITVEPAYPPETEAHGGVILSADVGEQGQLDSVKVLRGLDPLTPVAVAAVHQWHFAPGRRAGVNVSSPAIIVFTFTRPVTAHRQASGPSQ